MVALKFLPPELTRDKEIRERFMHEARSASALDHLNICTIYEIGKTDEGDLFIAMGYYEGETLKDKIKDHPPSSSILSDYGAVKRLKIKEVADITIQIANGLQDAHKKGFVHRDIKPANIFITNDGVVKILDFGLARSSEFTQLTKEGSTTGTVAYMSPEQSRGAKVDQRTDIWSLGVVMYEMITGEQPFKGDYEQAVIYSILNEEPQPLRRVNSAVTQELEEIILQTLAKRPADRYQTLKELHKDLEAVTQGLKPRKTRSAGRAPSNWLSCHLPTSPAILNRNTYPTDSPRR